MRIYIGTYTRGASAGIYFGQLDPASGRMTVEGAVGGVENPSFLAIDPRRRCLYAVQETDSFAGQTGGAVSAFRLNPETGQPVLLNSRPSGGTEPCHLSVDLQGRFVLAANYGGGSVALLPLEEDGSLADGGEVVVHQGRSLHPERQDRPHAHMIAMDPTGRYALVSDLGMDQILRYEPEGAQGRLRSRTPPFVSLEAGSGPRHLTFSPNGNHVYVVSELASTLTVWSYHSDEAWDSASGLQLLQTLSTLPLGFTGENFGKEVQMHPSGRFLYVSNSGHDSLAIFAVDLATGSLIPRGHVPSGGQDPRHFALTPDGDLLLAANQQSDNIVSFRIDPQTGALTPTGQSVSVPTPACIQMLAWN